MSHGTKMMFRWRLAAIALVLLTAGAWPAAARSWRIADFHASIGVSPDGATEVTERIQVVFEGQYQGIWRSIPIAYPGPGGSNYSLFLSVASVTDERGQALKYEMSRAGADRKIKIYIPDALDTTKTIGITYTMPNAIRYFDDHDELYWNVTGNDWPVPIEHASATVTLPPAAAGSLRAQAFTGVYGSVEREAAFNVSGATATFETLRALPMRGGLTIDLYIPKGVLRKPSGFSGVGWFLSSNPVVFLPLWSFLAMGGLWWFLGRDPDPGISVAPIYEPPAGMTPAEAGTLIDDRVDARDITATLVDLAVRGFLRIEQVEVPGLLIDSRDYSFVPLKPWARDEKLAEHERLILDNMFGDGMVPKKLSDLKNRFYTAVPKVKSSVHSSLRRKGMYVFSPAAGGGFAVLGALFIAGTAFLAHATGMADLFASPGMAILAIVVSLFIVIAFGRKMPKTSRSGARTRVEVRGFEEFMNRVDAERLKTLPPESFEKYLPFAMALGVEHHWAQAFAGIVMTSPSWYVSGSGQTFNPVLFSSSMHTMSKDVYATFVAAPRSSSGGSGFGGGGGFSGGGFGGGGGGAF
jgi:uncharacterized membrane protein